MTAKTKAAAKSKGGRPSRYRAEFAEQAVKLCRLGATDKDLADFFEVTERTINAWKSAHPKFLHALKEGKQLADAEVANSLFNRAVGYSHPDVHITNHQGEITQTAITKHYPPDATSMIFWLKNRQPARWRDRPDEGQGGGGMEKVLSDLIAKLPD